jgi:glycosyltransferase involved in cell wall biosynthesis
VGDGPLRPKIQSIIRELGLEENVDLPGFLTFEQLQREYEKADFLLFTGEIAPDGNRDGLPNVIPEAMAQGTLVLSTAVGATTEAIHDQKTGLLLPHGDPEPWVESVVDLQGNPERYDQIVTAAYDWIQDHYRLEKNIPLLLQKFQQAASNPTVP